MVLEKIKMIKTIFNETDLPDIKGEYRFSFPLANSTWFRVGGNADILFRPKDSSDLSSFIKNKPEALEYITLGVCSNVIIRDGGFRGCVIKLGRNFASIRTENDRIIAGAGALDTNVARFAAENNMSGLEFLIGIPGTIGGALAMNAGAYGMEIKDVLESARAIDKKGDIIELRNSDFGFTYRKNALPKDIIFTEVTFNTKYAEKEKILEAMQKISDARESTQPVRTRTGGSTFKNPEGDKKAWQLIDAAGLRGYKKGGASVSEKHCNFLINENNATAADIEDLGEEIRKHVKNKFGVLLEWEIKRLGEK
jgi:UDP-N-acetylmuramate dehydrogenase